jgi:gamma-glutamyl-gamma-aminobutyrate hydrolase PuuD
LPEKRFVLGVQWHPEADVASSVIGALVQAAMVEPAGQMQARGIAS